MMAKYLILETDEMDFEIVDSEEEAKEAYERFVRYAVENGLGDGEVIFAEIKKSTDVESIVKAALDE